MHLAESADPQSRAALEQYETGMKFFVQQKFDKAKAVFEKLRGVPQREIAERATTHLAVCNQRLHGNKPNLKNAEDHYNHAVLLMNQSQFDEAQEELQRAIKMEGKKGHFEYALAALHALKNDTDAALVHLREAIALDTRNRYLARTDDDFRLLMDDPRFTEVIYPERG